MSKASLSKGRQRPNYLYAVLSVSAVLFLVGLMGLILLQTQQLNKLLKEQIDIIVELTNELDDEQRKLLQSTLAKSHFILPNSVQYTSKEEALAIMTEELGEDLLHLDLPNPLSDVFTFNVSATYLQADSLARIKALLTKEVGVHDVYYQEDITAQLARSTKRAGWVLFLAGLLFLAIAVTVIHNTIRLALYGNRMLIKTQEMVGASWEFISQPFLRRAIGHGVLSGVFAVGLLVLLQWWLRLYLPDMAALQDPLLLGTLFLGLVLLGILISWLSTYVVVRRYLSMRVEELY